MNGGKATYGVVFLAAVLLLSVAAAIPLLPKAEATTTVISSDTTLGDTTVNAGDTLIINPGVTVTMSGTLTNDGNIVNSGAIDLSFNDLENNGIIINTAGANIRQGVINNFETGIITEDAGSSHGYGDSNFNNYGTHIAHGKFDISAYDTFGIYTNHETGIFESHDAAIFSQFINHGYAKFNSGALFLHLNSAGGKLFTDGTIDNYGYLSADNSFPGGITVAEGGTLNNHEGGTIDTNTRPTPFPEVTVDGILNNDGAFTNEGHISVNGIFNNNGVLENNIGPNGATNAVIDIAGTFNNNAGSSVANQLIINNLASGTVNNDGTITNECGAEFNNEGTYNGNPVVDNCTSFPITHMEDTTASAGYGVYAPKPARAEYVTETSQLVGDQIDSITLRLKSVGTISGTAEIGVFNDDLSTKKLFGTLDVGTLTTAYTDYEFTLAGDELYTIEAGDRIGIKYTGGSSTTWVSVMLDLDSADPFDGANSYLNYYQSGSWQHSTDRDMYMILKQTHG